MTPNNPPLQETTHKYGYPQAGVTWKELDRYELKRKEKRVKKGNGVVKGVASVVVRIIRGVG